MNEWEKGEQVCSLQPNLGQIFYGELVLMQTGHSYDSKQQQLARSNRASVWSLGYFLLQQKSKQVEQNGASPQVSKVFKYKENRSF
jgi:hypothetical protein